MEAWEEAAASWEEEEDSEGALAPYRGCPAARRGRRCTVRGISIHFEQPPGLHARLIFDICHSQRVQHTLNPGSGQQSGLTSVLLFSIIK